MKRSIVFILSVLSLAGCGYQQAGKYSASNGRAGGYKWQSLYRQDIATVCVPIFTNRDFERGAEFKVTSAVIHQLEANTPYKVAVRERADTILEGEITRVNVQPVSEGILTATPQEQLLTITVNFVWKDLRTGRILVERGRNFDQSVAYYPTLGEGSFVGTQDAAEKLALGIVHELQADW